MRIILVRMLACALIASGTAANLVPAFAQSEVAAKSTQAGPLQTSLTCAVVEPTGKQGMIRVSINEQDHPSVKVVLSTLQAKDLVVDKVYRLPSTAGSAPDLIQLYVDAPLGPLALRLIRRADEWGVELAPFEWSLLSGPLATGRCTASIKPLTGLKPIGERPPPPSQAVVGMPPKRWQWGVLNKQCHILRETSVGGASVSINDAGTLSYTDASFAPIASEFKPIFVATEFGHTAIYGELRIIADRTTVKLAIHYRQGRLWLDGYRTTIGERPDWFRGVCVEKVGD